MSGRQRKRLRWYGDDSDLNTDRVPSEVNDIVLIRGFDHLGWRGGTASERGRSLKDDLTGAPDTPIKRCLNAKHFERQGLGHFYERTRDKEDEWKTRIPEAVATREVKLVVAATQVYSADKGVIEEKWPTITRINFSNALERVAFEAKSLNASSVQVVIDRSDQRDSNLFDAEYRSLCWNGRTAIDDHRFDGGKLKDLRFVDSLSYASSRSCSMIRVADLVVGATRQLFKAVLRDYSRPDLGVQLAFRLGPRFRKSPTGRIAGWGIVLRGDLKSHIEKHLREKGFGEKDLCSPPSHPPQAA